MSAGPDGGQNGYPACLPRVPPGMVPQSFVIAGDLCAALATGSTSKASGPVVNAARLLPRRR